MMKTQQRHSVPPSAYDEERMAFEQVIRKLVSTKPTHKAAVGIVKHNVKKSSKKL